MQTLSIAVRDDHVLSGTLEMPSGLVRGAAVFAHCFTCTKQSRAAVSVARALADEGIACLRFDFTGLGGSDGEFGTAGFATDIEDLIAVADHLYEKFSGPLLLVGHSLGGAAVLAAAARLGSDKVAALATIGAPSDVPHVLENISGDLEAIERDGTGEVQIGGRPFKLSRDFLHSTRGVDLLELVGKLRIPYVALHSPSDSIVGIDHAAALFQAAFHPKSFISLAGADHLLTDPVDAKFAASIIANWAQRYLPGADVMALPKDGVVVQTGHGKFGTEVHTSSHRFVADEPKSYGGDDTGPTPYDLLLAALGTCTAMTMKMYADRKKWPFEGTRIHVTHERNHAEDCGHIAYEEEGMEIQSLNREIEILGDDLTDDQRAKIIEIADKCPVHKTLEGHLHIHTQVKG
ncbi:alpha/beta fold hydrolase [Erythrobacter sp. MTPC3]|uniref:bifunctional alpha/beta hydrolase/OsmC family protein n=1 Tax=Erythrobacter sp. MTPC3 TaxID=3056564 RepID=UPI0036F30796